MPALVARTQPVTSPRYINHYNTYQFAYLSCFVLSVLRLRNDEIVRYDKSLCGGHVSARPYGELGPVEIATCCCFVCVDSKIGTIFPSYCYDRRAANSIANTLNEIFFARTGDVGLTLATEHVGRLADEIVVKSELIARKQGIQTVRITAQNMIDR